MPRRYNGTVEEDNIEELEDAFFENARPLKEVFPALAEYSHKKLGRPKKLHPKREVKLRIDPNVLESFKATGRGWQTRMNAVLKAWAQQHPA